MRKVVVNKEGLIINAIEIEENANWKPPEDCLLLPEVASRTCDIGDTWNKATRRVLKPILPPPVDK